MILLIVFIVYCIIIAVLWKLGILEKHGIVAQGPILIIKTQKGTNLLKKIASRPRFWRLFGTFSIVAAAVLMTLSFLQIAYVASLSTYLPKEYAPSPRLLLGVPGINPIIPISYGILGLAVALVVHEFSHGILTIVGKIKLKSVGLLVCLFPIGAFVEPDEEEILAAKKIKRMHVYAVGPIMNMVVCFICAVIFSMAFMSAINPIHNGVGILAVGEEEPSGLAGLEPGMIIGEMDGQQIDSAKDFELFINDTEPGQQINLTIFRKDVDGGLNKTLRLVYNPNMERYAKREWYKNEPGYLGVDVVNHSLGVEITDLMRHSPGKEADLEVDMIITHLDNVTVQNSTQFYETIYNKGGGTKIWITYLDDGNTSGTLATLGISKGLIGIKFIDPNFVDFLNHPLRGVNTPREMFYTFIGYISPPLVGLSPMKGAVTEFYDINGWGAYEGVYWVLANSFYWIFWINLMLGLTNVLPAVPLDGGYLFKDMVDGLGRRLKLKRPEKLAGTLTTIFSFMVLFFIIWIMVAPRLNIFG